MNCTPYKGMYLVTSNSCLAEAKLMVCEDCGAKYLAVKPAYYDFQAMCPDCWASEVAAQSGDEMDLNGETVWVHPVCDTPEPICATYCV